MSQSLTFFSNGYVLRRRQNRSPFQFIETFALLFHFGKCHQIRLAAHVRSSLSYLPRSTFIHSRPAAWRQILLQNSSAPLPCKKYAPTPSGTPGYSSWYSKE